MPFWFWNDTLKDEEIIRQIADFEAHGVYGFVIHPRIGLPENIAWLSPSMIHSMKIATEEAARRGMYVILYDEGMYPSGSSSGQVVARNPAHAAKGLAKIDFKTGEKPQLADCMKLVATLQRTGGNSIAVVEQPSQGVIRGIHYIGEGTSKMREELPAAGDILNPGAVTSFIELVYDRYAKEFGSYFGNTITGIFTDEPSPLGRGSLRGVVPGNASLMPQINRILGYDFAPFLADLWYDDNPGSKKHRSDYNRAIGICLGENYYNRLSEWCKDHGIALMGHPSGSMDIGAERYFQVPGQDLVWRYVEPGPKALEGEHSTMAKCASSSMLHLGMRRNSNELYGAYGHNLTYGEMLWLANWCFVRGQNMLIPHAFYYSVRGPRFDERPPDVGPNAQWWNTYRNYADGCRRLSWLNTDSRQVCNIAILCEESSLPDKSARILYRNQRDFNYLETSWLNGKAKINRRGIHLAGMTYQAIILDTLSFIPQEAVIILEKLAGYGRLLVMNNSGYQNKFKGAIAVNAATLTEETDKLVRPDLILSPASSNIRYRHVVKEKIHYYILFNEEEKDVNARIRFSIPGDYILTDPYSMKTTESESSDPVHFRPHELKVIKLSR